MERLNRLEHKDEMNKVVINHYRNEYTVRKAEELLGRIIEWILKIIPDMSKRGFQHIINKQEFPVKDSDTLRLFELEYSDKLIHKLKLKGYDLEIYRYSNNDGVCGMYVKSLSWNENKAIKEEVGKAYEKEIFRYEVENIISSELPKFKFKLIKTGRDSYMLKDMQDVNMWQHEETFTNELKRVNASICKSKFLAEGFQFQTHRDPEDESKTKDVAYKQIDGVEIKIYRNDDGKWNVEGVFKTAKYYIGCAVYAETLSDIDDAVIDKIVKSIKDSKDIDLCKGIMDDEGKIVGELEPIRR